MAAATISEKKWTFSGSDSECREFQLSVMTSGQLESVAHGGPSGIAPTWVAFETVTGATTGDPVAYEHIAASDSTSNNTVAVRAVVAPGADIAGATVRVLCGFIARASGGLNP